MPENPDQKTGIQQKEVSREVTGRCLCGSVSYTANVKTSDAGPCHCESCRRWSGGVFLAATADGPVAFQGEENITRYKSSDWAERGFCKNCGSSLFYRLVDEDMYILGTGVFDDQSALSMAHQIFIDEKPDWYAFANETQNMTGAEVFAAFAPPDDGQ